jgi:hypothetical protein
MVVISPERPDTDDAITLITELEAVLDPLYPSESRHGYSVEKLLRRESLFSSSAMKVCWWVAEACNSLDPNTLRSSACTFDRSFAEWGSPG